MAAVHAKSSISSVLRRNRGMWTVYFSCNNSCCDVVHELSSVWRLCIFSKFCKGVNRLSILNIFIDYNWWFAQHHLGTRGFFSRATRSFVSSATGRHVFGRRPKTRAAKPREKTSGAERLDLPWTLILSLICQSKPRSRDCLLLKANRPLARWRHFTTTTRILQGFAFLCKLGLLVFNPRWDYQI